MFNRYMDFLDQYQSVSYGDAVFGMYVILPLQQTQNALLRQAVWQERCYLLQWMSLPLKQVTSLVVRFFLCVRQTPPVDVYQSCSHFCDPCFSVRRVHWRGISMPGQLPLSVTAAVMSSLVAASRWLLRGVGCHVGRLPVWPAGGR